MAFLTFARQRFIRMVVVMVSLIILTFVLARAFSDPVAIILPQGSTAQERATMRHALGLDKPLSAQFVDYVNGIAHGDFGESTWSQRPALEVVLDRLPASVLLATTATVIALVVGLMLGFLGGLRPGSLVDRISGVLTGMTVAIPDFWFGIILILVFAVNLGWVPTSGFDGPEYVILPAITLALAPAGRLAAVVRESVIEQMRTDYVLGARSRGLRKWQILRRHVFKNISVAASTILGYDFLMMFAGYAGVEVVFNWPGLGLLAVDSVLNQDVVLLSTIVLVTGMVVAVGNMALDLLHSAIDRRIG